MRIQIQMIVLAVAIGMTGCKSATPMPAPSIVPFSSATPTHAASAAAPTLAPSFGAPSRVTPSPSTAGPALPGRFVYAPGDGSLMIQYANSQDSRKIFDSKNETYADFPVFSPDGKQIAFATSGVKPDGTFRYDIRVINTDGTNEKTVATPENPNNVFSFPSWSADGREIYFTNTFSVPPAGGHNEIDRVNASGGSIRKLIDNVREAEVSSDGKKITYFKFDFQTFATSLWVANFDGSAPKMLVDTQTFLAMGSARFSPDSQTIVFAESGPPKKKLPGVAQLPPTGEDSCSLSFLFTCWVERAYAHGLPWDLWTVNLTGSKFEQLTKVGADSPAPAWSPDGKYIAFFEAMGIYLVDVKTKAITALFNGGGFGGFDWR